MVVSEQKTYFANDTGQYEGTPPKSTLSRRTFVSTSLGILLAPLLVSACKTPVDEEPEAVPTLTAQPSTPAKSATPGFSPLGLGGVRDGFLYVPEGYDPAVAAPLVVLLHGAGGTAHRAWKDYAPIGDSRGVIVLALDSRASSTWDLIRGGYGPDVAFIDRALQHTFERCAVDPERLALGGFSDGASYALSFGVSNGDLFSHLVAYSPGFVAAAEPIVGKPRIFVSHGVQDGILPVSASRDHIVPTLRNQGYTVTYHEFDGDHTVTWDVANASLAWLLGQDA